MKELTKIQIRKIQDILHYAVKKNVLIRSRFCEYCHLPCKTKGHHVDYNFPLQIVWLCHSCHRQFHSNKLKGIKDDILKLFYKKYS